MFMSVSIPDSVLCCSCLSASFITPIGPIASNAAHLPCFRLSWLYPKFVMQSIPLPAGATRPSQHVLIKGGFFSGHALARNCFGSYSCLPCLSFGHGFPEVFCNIFLSALLEGFHVTISYPSFAAYQSCQVDVSGKPPSKWTAEDLQLGVLENFWAWSLGSALRVFGACLRHPFCSAALDAEFRPVGLSSEPSSRTRPNSFRRSGAKER